MTGQIVNAKTGIGAGIGGVLGFLLGGPLGAGLGLLVGGGIAHKATGPIKGVMTPKRALIYKRAMESMKDPNDLRRLAAGFGEEGLHFEAMMLSKRAGLRELDPKIAEARRQVYRKAMASDNVASILTLAAQYAAEGAIDAAKTMRDHAEAVKAAHAAGKSAQPSTEVMIGLFAEKLGKALQHFGPESPQVQSAARNLILSQGSQPTAQAVQDTIRIAEAALAVEDAPPVAAAPEAAAAEAIDDTPEPEGAAVAVEEEAPAVVAAPATPVTAPVTGAVEPTVVGPAAGVIEQPIVGPGEGPVVGADVHADDEALAEAEAEAVAAPGRMRVA